MHDLDLKDKKLLYEIDLNARLGTTILAKKIGLSQEGVFYRLQRLEKKNIISGYMTLLNFGKLGYTGHAVYARFQNVNKEKKEQIFNELKQHDHIYWIAEFGGKYDIAFALMAKNIIHFNEMYIDLATRYKDVLKDFTPAIRVELIQFPRNYLLGKKDITKKTPRFGGYIEEEEIDNLDKNILRKLSKDARISALKLSQQIKEPVSTVSARIKQLEKKEIIQGYSAQIRCQEFEYQSYQLFLTTHNLTKEKKQKLLHYCQAHPHIIFYIETVGKWNFEIIYEVENQKQFQEFIIELRTIFSDVILDMESIVLFDHFVKYNQYPLK